MKMSLVLGGLSLAFEIKNILKSLIQWHNFTTISKQYCANLTFVAELLYYFARRKIWIK